MSTKIYDAYRLIGEYDLYSLNSIFDKLKKGVSEICNQIILDYAVKQTLYFYNFKQLHGEKGIKKMIDKTSEKKNMCCIWKNVAEDNWQSVYVYVYLDILDNIKESPNIYGMNVKMQMIPIKDKILVMYFGNNTARDYLEETSYFEEYHYQNQTDKPEGISKAAWNKRCKDWDDAIGPDYIPAHHGFGVNLYDVEYIFPTSDFKNRNINFPTEKYMLKELRDTLESIHAVDGYPKDVSYSSWISFTDTDAYKVWEKEANELIESKCRFITEKKDFANLIKVEI